MGPESSERCAKAATLVTGKVASDWGSMAPHATQSCCFFLFVGEVLEALATDLSIGNPLGGNLL